MSATFFHKTQRARFILLLLFFLLGGYRSAFAQLSDTTAAGARISLSAVVDTYYTYDFNRPVAGFRQPFLFNHNRHQEFNLNLGLIRAAVLHERYRAGLSLQAGTYAMDNYANEEALLQHVFEAFAGISLSQAHSLWLDAGIFGSHIGFESAISSENWTPTRSLLAENSPYFLAGAKLSYKPAPAWLLTLVLNNGWQRIRRVAGSSLPAVGTQLNYESGNITLNWSTFTGTDDPDIMRRMRYFNNLYGQFQFSEKLGLIAGLDTGIQQKTPEGTEYALWYSPVLIGRYAFNNSWATALRAEYYSDEHGVIVEAINLQPFRTAGFSANLDYHAAENAVWRIEGRWFRSPNEVFYHADGFSRENFFITTTLTVNIGGN